MKRLSIQKMNYLRPRGSRLALAAVLAVAGVPAALAQTPKGKYKGNIEEAEIEIVKERVNSLPEATRNYEKIKLPEPVKPDRKVAYTYPDFRLPADRLNPSVKVLTIRAEEPAPLTGNFVKAGIGNYGTFYGRGYFHSTRDTDHAYGLDIKHVNSLNGPVDGKNSSVAQTSAHAMGEIYRGTAAIGANLDFGRGALQLLRLRQGRQRKPCSDARCWRHQAGIQPVRREGLRPQPRPRAAVAIRCQPGLPPLVR